MAQKNVTADTERKKTQSDCVTEAIWAGAKSSAWAGATSGSLVLLANQYWPAFRSSLGVSGKTALIVSVFPTQTHNAQCTASEALQFCIGEEQ